MVESFITRLGENAANVLTIASVVVVVAAIIYYWRARRQHIKRLRAKILGKVPLDGKIKETLGKVFNLDTAEIATIGTVTLVDVAWHYSMADPHIWDHFSGPAGTHISNAIQNLDVLKSSLGDTPIAYNILEYFKRLEATQLFHELTDKISFLDHADSASVMLDAKTGTLVDELASHAGTTIDAKTSAVSHATGLLTHIPMVTIGFASYRAWRRAQKGTVISRNLEFAAIEVTTRAGGGLAGSQLGGAIGTAIVPGVGTIIGGIAGSIAGAIGGALLGEEFKTRHIRKAQTRLNQSLEALGKPHLVELEKFVALKDVFVEHERQYTNNLDETRKRKNRYALLPWRTIWPDEKLILLQETVKLAEERLSEVKQGTIDAVERLDFMRTTGQYQQMGIILWSDPALCQRVTCHEEYVHAVADANNTLRYELAQSGRVAALN